MADDIRVTQAGSLIEAVLADDIRVTQAGSLIEATGPDALRTVQAGLLIEYVVLVYQGSTGPAGQGTHQGKGPKGYRGKRHGGFGLDTHRTVQIVV